MFDKIYLIEDTEMITVIEMDDTK